LYYPAITPVAIAMTAAFASAGISMQDPIHQFEIVNLIPVVRFGPYVLHFTNSALFMLLAVVLTGLLLLGTTTKRQIVPGRLQSIAEYSHEFIANMIRSTSGEEGMRFFPFVFSLFAFILILNMVGLIPWMFTVTSHIIITGALALLVFAAVLIFGLYNHGLRFFRLFVPSGVPGYILPVIVFIEVLSFLSRPLSHSIRLFANMLAGHITLKVFAGFVAMLGAHGVVGWLGAVVPLSLVVILTALELLVAFLQAYVFAILTCIYLNDALHPGH
jgi:F-type H+-transporting ATPase subunit a